MATPQYHFISGLPRSGSTLLAALLLQNPRFHAGMSSPVGGMFTSMMGLMAAGSEFAPQFEDAQKRRILRGLFNNYYGQEIKKEVVFDTNRMWCARMSAVLDMFPGAKIIACVRNVAWIMDSIERMFRANPYENTRLFGNNMGRSTVYTRLEGLAQHDQLSVFLGQPCAKLFYGANASSLLVLDYELLAQVPQKVMPLVYQFIGEPFFEHDFDNVAYDAPDYDLQLGMPGLHRVQPKVAFKTRRAIIRPTCLKNIRK